MTTRRASRLGHGGLLLLTCWLVCLSITCVRKVDGAEVSPEYFVKAAFLYNIPKFVEWPPGSFANGSDPIIFGVLGTSPFGDQLDVIVKGRKLNGRSVIVKQIHTLEEAKTTHLLFISADNGRRFSAIRDALYDSPVLTISESTTFFAGSGMINFVLVDEKVRFDINMTAAEHAGFKVSAQLQKLASAIQRKL